MEQIEWIERNEIRLETQRNLDGFSIPPPPRRARNYTIGERKQLTELLRNVAILQPRWPDYVAWRNLKDVVRGRIGEEHWEELMTEIGEDLEMSAEGVNSIRSYTDSGPSAEV